MHQSIKDAGLLNNTFYLNNGPSTRFRKIKALLCIIVKNLTFQNLKRIYFVAFRNKSSLSVYELINYIGKPEYDVLHAHFGPNGNYVVELKKLGLFSSAKFITTFHGFDLNPKYKQKSVYKKLFASCNCFTVNTIYSRTLLENLDCDKNKIEVLPVGLQPMQVIRKESDQQNVCIRLLFVGRLIKLKGPDRFVEICNIVKHIMHIRFTATIVGNGEMAKLLASDVQRLQLENELYLIGDKTHEEVISLMNESDIFILPGIVENDLAETQGLVIQEAQAMRLPVLVSDAGGMAEGVKHGITGFVLPQNDLYAFARKIVLLTKDKMLRQKMGDAGRRFVEEKYDSNKLNEQLLMLYQKN